jgi:lysophospholipase L1-like esterase
MTPEVLYTIDQGSPAFEAARTAVDIVCAGDSLTGWNNFGPARTWPYPTYPGFLQELCVPRGLWIANGGIAGEISNNGPQQVRDYLELFPNARYFVFGMGTNDLGSWPDTAATSKKIIGNLGKMLQAVQRQGKKAVLFNVPNANEAMFPSFIVKELREKRDYHNVRLKEFCGEQGIPLADIYSKLKDEHFADELHPNAEGAKIIAGEVFKVLSAVHKSAQESSR